MASSTPALEETIDATLGASSDPDLAPTEADAVISLPNAGEGALAMSAASSSSLILTVPPPPAVFSHQAAAAVSVLVGTQHHSSVGVATSTIAPPESEMTVDINPVTNAATIVTGSRTRVVYPPPSEELIYFLHENDVLSGRGATTNSHVGNSLFRHMCAMRKPQFDAANNRQKREIATSIVEAVLSLPGRFLKRAEDVSDADVAAAAAAVEMAAVVAKAPEGVESTGAAAGMGRHADKKAAGLRGPWRDMGVEKAILKTFQVLRDHKRLDRIALRAMGMLRKGGAKISAMDSARTQTNEIAYAQNTEASESKFPPEEAEAAVPAGGDPNAFVPTAHDVISGRGAFVNVHPGNRRFRLLALQRKPRFDGGSFTEKRALAAEIVTLTRLLDPPGRFLRRSRHALTTPVPLSDGSFRLQARGFEGPWEELDEEKSFHKAGQVMRDIKMNDADLEALSAIEAGALDALLSPTPVVPEMGKEDDDARHHAYHESSRTVVDDMVHQQHPAMTEAESVQHEVHAGVGLYPMHPELMQTKETIGNAEGHDEEIVVEIPSPPHDFKDEIEYLPVPHSTVDV